MSSNKPSSGSNRVYRGGCWSYVPAYARVANRYYNSPGGRLNNLGFRLVRTVSALELIIKDCHE